MAESNRIEDLRKRYHENPRRFFAPLANEYRKGGFLDRAILLCEKHLGEQPDNMNGLVVYGQVLFESGKQDEARGPFEAALRVDPENLIALRHLGDIARHGGDVDEAKRWYLKVLEVDRRNDEVLDLLERLGGVEGAPAAGTSAPATSPLVSVAPNVSVSGGDETNVAGMIDAEPASAPPPKKPAPPMKTAVIDVASLAAADLKAAAPTAEVPAPVPASVPVPVAEPPKRPSKRASLLDIAFDFSDIPTEEPPPALPAAPLLSAEAAEYGFAAEFSPEASPMAGLESAEFIGGADAPALEGLDTAMDVVPPDEPRRVSEVIIAPVELANPLEMEMSAPAVAPLSEIEEEPSADPTADLPLLGDAPPVESAADAPPLVFDDLDVSPSEDQSPLPTLEPESAPRPKPRMTKSDMSSLPLLADFGLDDDDVPPPIEAPAVEAPAAEVAEPRRAQPTPTFVTETMAALYIKQGFRQEAIDVYRQLIAQDPNDAGLQQRLAALENTDQAMPEFEAPAADASEPTPAPANAALAEVSFAGVGLETPVPAAPIKVPAAAESGPSAREFFSGFARRAAIAGAAAATVVATAAVPAAASERPASPTGWPLDAIFTTAPSDTDARAAEIIASVGTFEGPSGGTGLDELFASGGAASATPPSTRTINRASESLKFDQFFAAPGTSASAAPDDTPPAPDDDDLDQFHGWLKGLKP